MATLYTFYFPINRDATKYRLICVHAQSIEIAREIIKSNPHFIKGIEHFFQDAAIMITDIISIDADADSLFVQGNAKSQDVKSIDYDYINTREGNR